MKVCFTVGTGKDLILVTISSLEVTLYVLFYLLVEVRSEITCFNSEDYEVFLRLGSAVVTQKQMRIILQKCTEFATRLIDSLYVRQVSLTKIYLGISSLSRFRRETIRPTPLDTMPISFPAKRVSIVNLCQSRMGNAENPNS